MIHQHSHGQAGDGLVFGKAKVTWTRCSKILVTNMTRACAGTGKTCSMMMASSFTAWVMALYRAARERRAVMALLVSVTCPAPWPSASSRASMKRGLVLR